MKRALEPRSGLEMNTSHRILARKNYERKKLQATSYKPQASSPKPGEKVPRFKRQAASFKLQAASVKLSDS